MQLRNCISTQMIFAVVILLFAEVFVAASQAQRGKSPASSKAQTQNVLYTNKEQSFSIQPPMGSQQAPCSNAIVCYEGLEDKFGPAASFQLSYSELKSDLIKSMVEVIQSERGAELFSALALEALKGYENAHLVDSVVVSYGQFRGVKSTISMTANSFTLSGSMVMLPVTSQNRLYTFVTMATPLYFGRWSAVTDKSIASFNILSPIQPQGGASATEIAFWETIKNSNNPEDLKAYLDKYPKGAFVTLARIRLEATKAKNR